MTTSSAELNALLRATFERIVASEDEKLTSSAPFGNTVNNVHRVSQIKSAHSPDLIGAPPQSIPSTKDVGGRALPRGDVERHQPFRVRKTANGHRLPPLPDSNFDVKLAAKRRAVTGGATPSKAGDNEAAVTPTSNQRLPPRRGLPPIAAEAGRRETVDSAESRGDGWLPPPVVSPIPQDASMLSHHGTADSALRLRGAGRKGCGGGEAFAVHRRVCLECQEAFSKQLHHAFVDMERLERLHRDAIEVERVDEREAVLCKAFSQLCRWRLQEMKSREAVAEAAAVFRRQCDILQQKTLRLYHSDRHEIILDWEIGFDEIAALERLSTRHLQQLREVRDKSNQRRQAHQEAERVQTEQRDEERRKKRRQMAHDRIFSEEDFDRQHLCQMETAVRGAQELVFREARKKISDAEAHVHNMISRHLQRLANIESEKERMKSEEVARRELMVATEKRAFETMQQLEPEQRRKTLQLQTARLKKQSNERAAVETAAETAIQSTMQEAQEVFSVLVTLAEEGRCNMEARRLRRLVKERRRQLRVEAEAREKANVQAEDDAAWSVIRYRFANALHYPCMEEEVRARTALALAKKIEKDFIWDLLRARLYLNQSERRDRKTIEDEEQGGYAVLYEILKQANNLATFLWYETAERRTIHTEWLDVLTHHMELYGRQLQQSARLSSQCPRSRTDKVVSLPNSEYAVWLRSSSITWFWLSEDLVLLDGSSLRSGTSPNSVVTEVKNVSVLLEILNPDDGDELYFKEPNNPLDPLPLVFSKKSLNQPVSATFSGGTARDLLASIKFTNHTSYSKYRLFPRVVRVTIASVPLIFHVYPAAPLCPLPSIAVTSRLVYPMTLFSIPSWQDFKTCRIVLSLNEANVTSNSGHRLFLQLPADFTHHAKNGIMHQGKVLMRPKQLTDRLLEIEFDPKPNAVMRTFLQTIALQHGDDTSILLPLQLDVFLLRKSDGSTMRVSQKLDVDSESADWPMLRVPSSDLYYRLSGTTTSEVVDPFIPRNDHHVLSFCTVVFPPNQKDVQGGVMKVQLQGHDTFTTIGLHCTGPQRLFVLDAARGVLLYRLGMPDYDALASGSGAGSPCTTGRRTAERHGSVTAPQQAAAPSIDTKASSRDVSDIREGPETSRGGASSSSTGCGAAASLTCGSPRTSVTSDEADRLRKEMGYVPIASVFGIDTVSVQFNFRDDVALPPIVINHIIRSLTVFSTRRAPGNGKRPPGDVVASMKMLLLIDLGLTSEPIESTFKLSVCMPVLECSAKGGGFPYREGAGPKVLPSLGMKVLPNATGAGLQLPPDSMITVEIVSGLEDSDEIDVVDCELMANDLYMVHMQNNQPVALVERVHHAAVRLTLCGGFHGESWLRRSIEDAYQLRSTSHVVMNKMDVAPTHVNVLLRSIRYNCNSVDPQEEKKVVLVTFDDGRTGRSSIALDLAIETVDDPTDIVMDDPVVEFRQNSRKSNSGCPILPKVRLEDIDSDNFHGGYIIVEHCSGPAEVGDHLYFMTPKQQEQLLYRAEGRSSVTHLQYLLSTVADPNACPALATVVDEQPQNILTVRENRYLSLAGESIGQIVTKQAGSRDDRVTHYIRMNFSSETKFVSFPAAEYCLRCLAFDNRSAKMNTVQRQYQITLNCTGLKSTCDTVEKVTVDGYVALLANPPYASVVRHEEGGRAKCILKQATTALTAPQLFQRGYLRVTILNPFEGDEVQVDPNAGDFKVKDGRTILNGKDNIASIPQRKGPHVLQIDFLKINNALLQGLVRSIIFTAAMRNIDPTPRQMEVECSTGNEVDTCCVNLTIDIQRRDEPIEFSVAPSAPPLLYMSGQPPAFVAGHLNVSLRKPLVSGIEMEFSTVERPRVGEHVALMSTPDVDVSFDEEMQRVHLTFIEKGERFAAYAPKAKEIDGAAFLYGKSVSLTLVSEHAAADAKRLIDCLCYINTCRSDRGIKKPLSIAFRQRATLLVRTQVSIEIIAPALDFSLCNSVLHATQGSVYVAPACRMQLASSLRFVEIHVACATGYDFSDTLSFRFPHNDPFGFLIDDGSILITNPQIAQQVQAQINTSALVAQASGSVEEGSLGAGSLSPTSPGAASLSLRRSLANPSLLSRDGKSLVVASVVQSTTSIAITSEGVLSNSALQALLRAIHLSGEPRGEKDILVELTVTSTCGQCRELVRVIL